MMARSSTVSIPLRPSSFSGAVLELPENLERICCSVDRCFHTIARRFIVSRDQESSVICRTSITQLITHGFINAMIKFVFHIAKLLIECCPLKWGFREVLENI